MHYTRALEAENLKGMQPLLMVLITPVLSLPWGIKISALKSICSPCTVVPVTANSLMCKQGASRAGRRHTSGTIAPVPPRMCRRPEQPVAVIGAVTRTLSLTGFPPAAAPAQPRCSSPAIGPCFTLIISKWAADPADLFHTVCYWHKQDPPVTTCCCTAHPLHFKWKIWSHRFIKTL